MEHALKDLRKAEISEPGLTITISKPLMSLGNASLDETAADESGRRDCEAQCRDRRSAQTRALSPEVVMLLVESARTSEQDVQVTMANCEHVVYLMSFMTGLRRQELPSLTPRSFYLEAPQPILKVKAACSKHRREDTLPMHPELVAMVRDWDQGHGSRCGTFPWLDKKKTWYMVQKDLERGRHSL